jgi:DNA (cytosine-5)-methyltransferase 1
MNVISLFSGCGGLDLGFTQAGFNIIWSNEYDKEIWETYKNNHPNTFLDKRSITSIPSDEIPDCDGIIGGPPCQSWSEAGARRGIDDKRGKLFFEFVRILKEKQPRFFLAENVSGILAPRNRSALDFIVESFENAGYKINFQLLNAKHYDVPQDRERLIVVGYRQDLGRSFIFPPKSSRLLNLRDAIGDLEDSATPAALGNRTLGNQIIVPNHEYMTGGHSMIFMSRNRVRRWDQQSFTIQAGGRHAPLHPQSSEMILVGKDKRIFDPNTPKPYRRLTVRECARIQTFPDSFIFYYDKITAGYKMVGNAVPVNFAFNLGRQIYKDLSQVDTPVIQCDQNMALRQLNLALS